MKRFSANYIYPISSAPIKNGIVEISDKGEILNVIDTKGELKESRNLEFHNGVIVPGFINTHCHLELSELKDKIEQQKGFPHFINQIVNYKRNSNTHNTKAIELFDSFMRKKGIVAIGDISNTGITIEVKKNSSIYYHTFIEAIGLGENAEEIFELNRKTYEKFININLSSSITPHSPYSVSKNLFKKIKEFSEEKDSILSIHNQESEAENQMFFDKTGDLVEVFKGIGLKLDNWEATGKKSLESILEFLPKRNNILFVHNTYSKREDVELVNKQFKNAYWCLCPKSNLFIEDSVPDFKMLAELSENITLGTDSLASNTSLSILEEMKVVSEYYNEIDFEKLLSWGTINGAKALKIDNQFGSIEKGKSPGLNLIENFNFKKMNISKKSEIKVLA